MDNLEKIKQEVFKQRPVLGEIIQKFGNWKLQKYIQEGWEVPDLKIDGQMLSIIGQYTNNVYGEELSNTLKTQLEKKPLVSTISHLGIWGHPIFVNADLIYSLHFNPSELTICLATESVSLNNTTSWSGSVLEHRNNMLHRASFFPDRLKTLPVFSTPGITQEEIRKFDKKLLDILEIDDKKNFSTQACQMSYNLWQAVFPSAPKLVYLPLESIVNEYILQLDSSNIIHRLIFTKQGQELWQKYFGNEHTFMFWGIDEKNRRKILRYLPDESDLRKLIEIRKLYPSSPLCFVVLLLCGLTCVGGFTQTTWLTEVKEKFIKLLNELGVSADEIKKVEAVPTKNFAESSLASLNISGTEIQPTALDLLNSGKEYYSEFFKRAGEITLNESLDKMMPTIYEVVGEKN